MFYLIIQIAVTLLFTALIGITIGWLLRGLGASRQSEAAEARWRARLAQLEQHDANAPAESQTPGAVDAPAAGRVIAELQRQIKQRDEVLETLRTAKNVGTPVHFGSKAQALQLQEATTLCDQLQGHLAEQRKTTDQLKTERDRATAEREMLVERLRDRETEIGRMSQERQHAINTIAKLQKEMRTIRGVRLVATSTPASTVSDARLATSGGLAADRPPAATQHSRRAVAAGPEAARDVTETASTTDVTGTTAAPLPAPATPAGQQSLPIADHNVTTAKPEYRPTWRLAAPEGPKDNLQAIFGIGPKLEMQLNSLGIFHFEQIGRFQSNDILWVAHHLKSFPGRIVRDRWIEQAQTLSNQKRN